MAIGGIDIGSTGSKITIYSEEGKLLHTGYRDYPVSRNMGTHEIRTENIWNAVRELLIEGVKAVPSLKGVGFTSFGESFVLLDAQDVPLTDTIMLYSDPRGMEEAKELVEMLGDEQIGEITGVRPHAMFSLPKMMWMKKRRPEIFEQADKILLMQDYMVYKLTGVNQIDYSLAVRTMAFDVHRLTWSKTMLDAAGIREGLLSKPVPSGTSAGKVRPDVAKMLGLPEDLEIVSCCHDQVGATVGAGALKPGMAVDGAGTVECITPVFQTIPKDGFLQKYKYGVIPHVIAGQYACYAFTFSGGSLIKWFIDTLAGDDKAIAKEKGISIYQQLESQMEDKPTGILVLPHFAGAGTPYMDNDSKGGIVGLTVGTTAAQMYRALMEGVVYEMALNLEVLGASGIKITMLNASGGGAASKVWLQMKADILNVPVTRMSVDEAGTVGGIMLTGVAVGVFDSLEHAKDVMVHEVEVFYPRAKHHEAYMEHYKKYVKMYKAIRPLV